MRKTAAGILAALATLAPIPALAGYLVTYANPSEVWLVNGTSDCMPTLVGSSMINQLTDVAVSSGGLLFACSDTHLYSINPMTGLASAQGPFMNTTSMKGLDFDIDERLFGIDAGGKLWEVNTGTGLATERASTGHPSSDLACFGEGTFFALALVSGEAHLIRFEIGGMIEDKGVVKPGLLFASLDFDENCDLIAIQFASTPCGMYEIPAPGESGEGVFQCNTALESVGGVGFTPECVVGVQPSTWANVKRIYR